MESMACKVSPVSTLEGASEDEGVEHWWCSCCCCWFTVFSCRSKMVSNWLVVSAALDDLLLMVCELLDVKPVEPERLFEVLMVVVPDSLELFSSLPVGLG